MAGFEPEELARGVRMDAEAPKKKGAVTLVKAPAAKADPFAEFEDWLVDGPAGEWPGWWDDEDELTAEQRRIVSTNAALLLNRNAWHAKVEALEAALVGIAVEDARKIKRSQYCVHFDLHNFGNLRRNFVNYIFPCAVSFDKTIFGDSGVNFDCASFTDAKVSFNGAIFGNGKLSFHTTKFGNGNLLFNKVKFGNGAVLFYKTTFGDGAVSFSRATFGKGTVSFKKLNFGAGDLIFDGATFGEGDVSFDGTNFGELTISASDMVVAGNLFIKSTFGGTVDFRRLKVGGTADFSGSTFAEVPDFRDAKLDRPPEVARMVVPKPKLVRKLWPPFRVAADHDDVAKYRKPKAMALAANDHEKDGEFFAYEMLAKRGVETTGFWHLLFNSFYYHLSRFGQSFTRPLVWMTGSWLVMAAVYSWMINPSFRDIQTHVFALAFSLRKSIPVVDALFRAVPSSDVYKPWYERTFNRLVGEGVNFDGITVIGMAHTFFGGVLLFLLLLALRNKFRLK